MQIQGGLGNQIFQIASGLNFCAKYNKKLILSKNHIYSNKHQKYNDTINIIKNIFPDICIYEYLNTSNYHKYNENGDNAFNYINADNSIINQNTNVIVNGYFITYKYFPENLYSIIKPNIKPTTNISIIISKYNNFQNMYFIHIRLGDYLSINLYKINLIEYYNYCINKILEQNSLAKFIICTNEYGINLSKYTNNFPKNTEYILQDETNDCLDTLYIMTQCCGGICSNSTLSWLGSYLQENKNINKNNIFMPYPWVNFINGFNENNIKDVYPDWTTIYDTRINTVMKL